MSEGLVRNQDAQDFLSTMELNTFLKVALGDPAKYEKSVSNAILKSHEGVKAGIATVKRLAHDESRTEPEKHYKARQVAEQVEAILTTSRASIESRANELDAEAESTLGDAFKTSLERQGIHAKLRSFIRDLARKSDIPSIRALMAESYEAASIIVHSPRVLLGLANDVHWSLREYAVKTHLPEVDKKFGEVVAPKNLAKGFPRVVRRVSTSFYNNAMADKYVRTRVEI